MINNEFQLGDQAALLRHATADRLFNTNPFPGLRPFGIHESHLFFGCEEQADELLQKLAEKKFIAVMGFSGSGKSSLMYCGLLPLIYGGFMEKNAGGWKVISTRPGDSPIENLAAAILAQNNENQPDQADHIPFRKKVIASLLKSSSAGLLEILKDGQESNTPNTLLLIDQFEELFRPMEKGSNKNPIEEAAFYINLLLEAIKSKPDNIYLAITMRSEYIGHCAQFPGLTDVINESNYLVPRMSREQKRRAIEGPIAVGGGEITDRLVKILLNDMEDSQDQLPVMQHALMRTWNYWLDNKEPDEPLDLRHYNAIGKIFQAMSLHANEAYDELATEQKPLVEVLFKALTQKVNGNVGLRRAVSLREIAQIATVDEEAIIAVVEVFRKPGRSLLMPPAEVPLGPDSMIEISHESLMRIWIRLKVWVEEEYQSAQMYKRLSEAAAMYQIGRTRLWRPPDLQLALNWQKKQQPTLVWAQRYDEAYERAIVFLDTSKTTYEAELKNQEMLQKRLLQRTKLVAVALGIAVIITAVFFTFAVIRQGEAEDNYKLATINEKIAIEQKEEAEKNKEEAERNRKLTLQKSKQLTLVNQELNQALIEAEQQKNYAQQQFIEAKRQAVIARNARTLAEYQRQNANENSEVASLQFHRAEQLFYHQLAQAVAVKSLRVEAPGLKGLLAYQAYRFNINFQGSQLDPYVYEGLYYALKSLEGPKHNTYKMHQGAVRSLAFDKDGKTFFTTGSDGEIKKASIETLHLAPQQIHKNPYGNRVIALSNNGVWLANGSDSSTVEIYAVNSTEKHKAFKAHQNFIHDIKAHPLEEAFFTLGADNTLWQYANGEGSLLLVTATNNLCMDISPDAKYIALGSFEGNLTLFNLETRTEKTIVKDPGNPIHTVAFGPNGDWIASGDELGMVKVIDTHTEKVTHTLKGHKSRVSSVAFNKERKLLASASFDGTLQVWKTEDFEGLPIVLSDNDAYIWDIAFSAEGEYLLAGCQDGEIRIWPTTNELMASKICGKVGRNLTKEEWNMYIGRGVNYTNTCKN